MATRSGSLGAGQTLPSDPAWGGPGWGYERATEGASDRRGDTEKWHSEQVLLSEETGEGATKCEAGGGRERGHFQM